MQLCLQKLLLPRAGSSPITGRTCPGGHWLCLPSLSGMFAKPIVISHVCLKPMEIEFPVCLRRAAPLLTLCSALLSQRCYLTSPPPAVLHENKTWSV